MYSSTQKLTGCWQMCLCISFTNTNTSAESMHCLAVDVLCAWQVMCKILCNLPQFSWTDILHPTAKGRQLPSLITYLNLYKCQRWLWLACDLIPWCTGVKLFLYYIRQVLTIFFCCWMDELQPSLPDSYDSSWCSFGKHSYGYSLC